MQDWIELITAVLSLIVAVMGFIALFIKVQAIHVLVNSQLKQVMGRVDQLVNVLIDADMEIPEAENEA